MLKLSRDGRRAHGPFDVYVKEPSILLVGTYCLTALCSLALATSLAWRAGAQHQGVLDDAACLTAMTRLIVTQPAPQRAPMIPGVVTRP